MWTHKGIPIEINSNGYFDAKVGEVEVGGISLAEVKEKIDERMKNGPSRTLDLKVVGIRDDNEVSHATLIGINRTERTLRYKGLPSGTKMSSRVLPDTPENTALIVRLAELRHEANKLYRVIEEFGLDGGLGYGRIESESLYNEKLDEVETRYHEGRKNGRSK